MRYVPPRGLAAALIRSSPSERWESVAKAVANRNGVYLYEGQARFRDRVAVDFRGCYIKFTDYHSTLCLLFDGARDAHYAANGWGWMPITWMWRQRSRWPCPYRYDSSQYLLSCRHKPQTAQVEVFSEVVRRYGSSFKLQCADGGTIYAESDRAVEDGVRRLWRTGDIYRSCWRDLVDKYYDDRHREYWWLG